MTDYPPQRPDFSMDEIPATLDSLDLREIEETEFRRGDCVSITRHGKTEHYVVREPSVRGAILDRLT
jgi:hypothetical protein